MTQAQVNSVNPGDQKGYSELTSEQKLPNHERILEALFE